MTSYTDRPNAGQRLNCARNPRLITTIPTFRQQKTRLLRPGLLTLVIATKERK